MKKRIFCMIIALILAFLLLSPSQLLAGPQSAYPDIQGESSILVDLEHGQVLYQKQPQARLHIAMASKIMTAVLILDNNIPLQTEISMQGINLELKGLAAKSLPKSAFKVEDLLYAMLMTVDNDSANLLASYMAETPEKFAAVMNRKAKNIGMVNTLFMNPSGSYDEKQYTTASDLALLIRHAVKNTTFANIFSSKMRVWPYTKESKLLVNQNTLFWQYDGMDGGKISYNFKDKYSIVTTATRSDRKLLAIILETPEGNLYQDSISLLNYGFSAFRRSLLVSRNQLLKKVSVENGSIDLISPQDMYYTYPLGENYVKNVEYKVTENVTLLTPKNKQVGVATYTLEDDVSLSVPIYVGQIAITTRTALLPSLIARITENRDIFYLLLLLVIAEVCIIMYKITSFLSRKIHKQRSSRSTDSTDS